MRFMCYPSDMECQNALDLVNANLRTLAVNNGYELDDNGHIIGKTEGENDPSAQPTERWSDASIVNDNGTTYYCFLDPYTHAPNIADELMANVPEGLTISSIPTEVPDNVE